MPKNKVDYSNTIIYMLCCLDVMIIDVYVGNTTNFTKRKTQHKTNCNNDHLVEYNFYVYQFIRDNGGWNNWNMIVLENVSCIDGNEARQHERKWMVEKHATLNKRIPSRTDAEYRIDNKDKIKEDKKQYRINNADKIKEYTTKYNINNADKIKEDNKQYRINNADKIKEDKKQYRINNADKIKEDNKQYQINNADKIKEDKKQYRINNADKIKKYKKEYCTKTKLLNFYKEYHTICHECK